MRNPSDARRFLLLPPLLLRRQGRKLRKWVWGRGARREGEGRDPVRPEQARPLWRFSQLQRLLQLLPLLLRLRLPARRRGRARALPASLSLALSPALARALPLSLSGHLPAPDAGAVAPVGALRTA